MKRHFYASAIALYVWTSGVAWAESSPVAAELFRAGTQAFESGDYRAAALSFEQAYERAPDPSTAYAAALSWFKANNKPRAADGYERALAGSGLDSERSTQARARLEALRHELGVIRVLAPRGERASLGYRVSALIPFVVYVLPGKYAATLVTGPDRRTERVEVKRGGVAVVRFANSAKIRKGALGNDGARKRRISAGSGSKTSEASFGDSPSPWLSIGAFGVAAASVGGALFFRAQALDSVDEFRSTGDRNARSAAQTERVASYGLWGLAGASVTLGTALLVWPRNPRTQKSTQGVAVSWSGSQLKAGVSF